MQLLSGTFLSDTCVGQKDVTSIDEGSRKRCFWIIDKETHKRERDIKQ